MNGLLEALTDPEPVVRRAASSGLAIMVRHGRAGSQALKQIEAGVERLCSDRDLGVREQAAAAIGVIGPAVSDTPPAGLIAMLKDEHSGAREKAIDAMLPFKDGLSRELSSLVASFDRGSPETQESLLKLFRSMRPPGFSSAAVPGFLGALGHHDPRVRVVAASRLAEFGREADSALQALMRVASEPMIHGPEDSERERLLQREPCLMAAFALGKVAPGTRREKDVVSLLIDLVRSGRSEQKQEACHSLWNFGTAARPAVPALIAALRNTLEHEPPSVPKQEPAYSRLPSASLIASLAMLARDTDTEEDAIATLIEALDSRRSQTRSSAIVALENFGPKAARAVRRLRELEKDEDPFVRQFAGRASKQLEPIATKAGSGAKQPERHEAK
jgi:HEAT repeat protein